MKTSNRVRQNGSASRTAQQAPTSRKPLKVEEPDGTPKEYKVVALRECAPQKVECDTPERVAAYWNQSVKSHPFFNPDAECLVVVMVNTRRCVIGHSFVSVGTLDACLTHAREIFRSAIVAAASAIVLIHNHPSGDPKPSEDDIRFTRELIRAGKLLNLQVLDHLVMGHRELNKGRGYCSLRELGYFYN